MAGQHPPGLFLGDVVAVQHPPGVFWEDVVVVQHPPGLFWVDVGEEHSSHSAVVHCSQVVWETAGYHQLRIVVEVLEEGCLQIQVDGEKALLYPH